MKRRIMSSIQAGPRRSTGAGGRVMPFKGHFALRKREGSEKQSEGRSGKGKRLPEFWLKKAFEGRLER